MSSTSDYEKIRLKNLADNKRVLAELGLLNPFKPFTVVKKAPKRKRDFTYEPPVKQRKVERVVEDTKDYGSFSTGSRRRSSRIQGKGAPTSDEIDEDVKRWEEQEEEDTPRKKAPSNRPNFYGAVPGVEIGTMWQTRLEACIVGVHRPTVAGIHGGEGGCYSIALSGGYDDDIDIGECFTYTGEGGRDLKGTKSNPKNLRTAPQSKDQTLTRGNLALSKNVETGNPVRVIRGYKLRSQFAPEEGYRYDGLYKVEKSWFTVGMSGFGVWKFAMRRVKDQALPPWVTMQDGEETKSESGLPCSQDSGFGSETMSESGSMASGVKDDDDDSASCTSGLTNQEDLVSENGDTKADDAEDPRADKDGNPAESNAEEKEPTECKIEESLPSEKVDSEVGDDLSPDTAEAKIELPPLVNQLKGSSNKEESDSKPKTSKDRTDGTEINNDDSKETAENQDVGKPCLKQSSEKVEGKSSGEKVSVVVVKKKIKDYFSPVRSTSENVDR